MAAAPLTSGSKKRAYDALERRFGTNLPVALSTSQPQESKAKKSKALGSRATNRDVARAAGRGGGLRDSTDLDSSLPKVGKGPFSRKAEKSLEKRDVTGIVGEEGPLDHLDSVPPPPSRDRIPANAPFYKNTPKSVSGVSDDNPGKAHHPAYFGLSKTFDENLIRKSDKDSSNEVGYAVRFMHDLLLNGDCSKKYMKGMQNMKFDDHFLLDNLAPNVSTTNERAKSLQSHSRRSKKHMSMKQHRKCGSFDFPPEFHSFDLFKPMHEMWKDYITKLLKETGRNQISSRLLTADLHGALLLVVECKTAAFIGIKGILVRETTETFGIITEKNKFRVVPKKGSVLIFQAGTWKITLVGDNYSSRVIAK